MKSLSPFFALALLSLGMLACSMGPGEQDQTKQYTDDRAELLNSFAPALGTFRGDIQATKTSGVNEPEAAPQIILIPLELGVYTEDVPSGKDNDGNLKLLPALRVRYRQLDAIRSDVILDGRFIQETGELNAASANGNTTVRAVLRQNRLQGEVIKNGGRLGYFSLTLKSKDVLAPATDETNELFERTVALYKSIAGTYTGVVTPPSDTGSVAPFPVQIQIVYVPVASNGGVIARLRASFKRLDFTDPSPTERLLDVSYRLETNPAELIMSMDGGNAQIPNAYFMSLNGFLNNGEYSADYYDRRGYVGVLKVQKK